MRLIDAHKLYEQYETAMRELVKSTNCENITLEALSLLCGAKLIADAPTVEAVPVKHGRWKAYSVSHWTKRYDDNGDPEYKNHNEYVCSICRRKTIVKEKFCPNCGAKMDLEEQDAKEET